MNRVPPWWRRIAIERERERLYWHSSCVLDFWDDSLCRLFSLQKKLTSTLKTLSEKDTETYTCQSWRPPRRCARLCHSLFPACRYTETALPLKRMKSFIPHANCSRKAGDGKKKKKMLLTDQSEEETLNKSAESVWRRKMERPFSSILKCTALHFRYQLITANTTSLCRYDAIQWLLDAHN